MKTVYWALFEPNDGDLVPYEDLEHRRQVVTAERFIASYIAWKPSEEEAKELRRRYEADKLLGVLRFFKERGLGEPNDFETNQRVALCCIIESGLACVEDLWAADTDVAGGKP